MTLATRLRRTTSSSAPFDPADILGMKVRLEADAITGLVDGDPISTWVDGSGNSNSPTGTTTTRPLWKTGILNGLAIARYDGSDDKLAFPSVPLSSSAATLFTIHKITTTDPPGVGQAASPIGSWCSDNTANDHWPFTDGNIYCGFGTTARKTVGNPSGAMTAFRIYCVVSAPSDYRFYIDGGAAFYSTATNTVGWTTAAPKLGASDFAAGAYRFQGDQSTFYAWDTALSLTDINRVGAYLAAKTALTWTTAT